MKKILVLGSAPGALIPADIENYFVIAANASIAPFPDLVPDVLILNGATLVGQRGIAPVSREQLRGRSVRHLIVIDNHKDAKIAAIESGIDYRTIDFWTKEKRRDVCALQSKITYPGLAGNEIPSTGVTAICYALALGGDVLVSGINVHSDGHSYGNETFARGHIEWDTRTLQAIAGRFETLDTLRESFESWWRENMDTLEMDLHRNQYPMTRPSDQPYACHETQRGWLAYQAGAACKEVET